MDDSNPMDVARGLEAMRDTFSQGAYKYACVATFLMGTGLGKQSYDEIYPITMSYLKDSEACFILSLDPEKTDMRPRYLGIFGPLEYGDDDKQRETIDWVIDKALTSWGTTLGDYEGIVVSGYGALERYIGGTTYLKDIEDTYVFKKTGKPALVVRANEARNGVAAHLKQIDLCGQICDDLILFKPKSHDNNRLSALQMWLNHYNDTHDEQKRVAVFGEKDIVPFKDPLLLPDDENNFEYKPKKD
jgi:hypothetical protein